MFLVNRTGPALEGKQHKMDPTQLLRSGLYLLPGLALALGGTALWSSPRPDEAALRLAEGCDLLTEALCSPFEGAEVLLLEREGAVVFRVARKKREAKA